MKQTKSHSQKQTKAKQKISKQLPIHDRQTDKQHPLQITINLLEQDIIRLQNTIQFYKKQIQQLQNLNLQLYHQLQQAKIKEQSMIRNSIIQLDIAGHKHNDLCSIIKQLQIQLSQQKGNNKQLQVRWEQVQLRLNRQQQSKQVMKETIKQLESNVQKYKLKLLQSQKYWITRIQIVIGQKEIQNCKVIKVKDEQLTMMSQLYSRQLALKEKMIRQKTQQIYKLITHIKRGN